MEYVAELDGNGIASIRHGLGTTSVQVRCLNAEGEAVGYQFHTPISPDEVEVVTVPGSGVAKVIVQPVADGH